MNASRALPRFSWGHPEAFWSSLDPLLGHLDLPLGCFGALLSHVWARGEFQFIGSGGDPKHPVPGAHLYVDCGQGGMGPLGRGGAGGWPPVRGSGRSPKAPKCDGSWGVLEASHALLEFSRGPRKRPDSESPYGGVSFLGRGGAGGLAPCAGFGAQPQGAKV